MKTAKTALCTVLALGCSKAAAPEQREPQGAPASAVASQAAPASAVASQAAPASAAAAPASSAPAELAGVVLLTIDSLRADMPWAGYERDIAPRLTALEKTCVSYTKGYSVSSYTAQSVAAMLASRLPSELSRDGYFFQKYPSSVLFFPELLQKAGIFTAAGQAHGYFKRAGFEQGFDRWEIVPNLVWNAQTDENVTSPRHLKIALDQLKDPAIVEQKRRFFVWHHFLDPHDQYISHEKDGIPSFGKKARDRYDSEVAYTDRHIGELLDYIAQQPYGDKVAIIISSDHGEAFGEHGRYRHAFELWEPLVRVPLMFCLPGNPPRRIDVRRSGIDIAPTVLDLLGLPPEPSFRGKSLLREVRGQEPAEERDVHLDLARTSTNGQRRALIRGGRKVIQFDGGVTRSFDLDSDPGEDKPLSGEAADAMRTAIREFNAGLKEEPTTVCRQGCLHGTK